jgi:hypothetical protein
VHGSGMRRHCHHATATLRVTAIAIATLHVTASVDATASATATAGVGWQWLGGSGVWCLFFIHFFINKLRSAHFRKYGKMMGKTLQKHYKIIKKSLKIIEKSSRNYEKNHYKIIPKL